MNDGMEFQGYHNISDDAPYFHDIQANYTFNASYKDSALINENINISSYANDDGQSHDNHIKAVFDLIRILTTVVVPILFGIIAFLGVIGNSLVIIVVLTNKQMRSTTNVLILNLAFADLLFVIFCIPFTATDYVLNEWRFGLVVCQAVQYLIYVTSYVSIYTLILMSIDRFLAVVFPVPSLAFRTVKNAGIAIFITWSVIGVVSTPIWMAHHLQPKGIIANGTITDQDTKYWCRFASDTYSEAGFHVAFFVSSYAIPLLLIVALYFIMLQRLWNPSGSSQSFSQHRRATITKTSKEALRNKRRVTKLVLVVIIVFCVSWAPIQLVLLLRAVGLYQTKVASDYPKIIFQIFSHVLAYVNSCINPILYAFLSDNFRKGFRQWLSRCVFCCFASQDQAYGGHGRGDGFRTTFRYELTTVRRYTRSRGWSAIRSRIRRKEFGNDAADKSKRVGKTSIISSTKFMKNEKKLVRQTSVDLELKSKETSRNNLRRVFSADDCEHTLKKNTATQSPKTISKVSRLNKSSLKCVTNKPGLGEIVEEHSSIQKEETQPNEDNSPPSKKKLTIVEPGGENKFHDSLLHPVSKISITQYNCNLKSKHIFANAIDNQKPQNSSNAVATSNHTAMATAYCAIHNTSQSNINKTHNLNLGGLGRYNVENRILSNKSPSGTSVSGLSSTSKAGHALQENALKIKRNSSSLCDIRLFTEIQNKPNIAGSSCNICLDNCCCASHQASDEDCSCQLCSCCSCCDECNCDPLNSPIDRSNISVSDNKPKDEEAASKSHINCTEILKLGLQGEPVKENGLINNLSRVTPWLVDRINVITDPSDNEEEFDKDESIPDTVHMSTIASPLNGLGI